jgi:hypothetical protein
MQNCAVHYRWKCSTEYIQWCNINCKNSTWIKVTKVYILLSCITKDPVMCVCEERHDLIWLFSYLYSWSESLHLFWNIYLSVVLQPFLLNLGRFFNFLILYTAGRTPRTGISQSQGHYFHTEQHKHRIIA